MAQERSRSAGGTLILRNEDLDQARCRTEFVSAMLEDLRWFGFAWQEGPNCGGPFGPYSQSERGAFYEAAFKLLLAAGYIYPCRCSRRDVQRALQAPHQGDEEPIYPGTCRPRTREDLMRAATTVAPEAKVNWRFRVPDGEAISFLDEGQGPQTFVAGRDFGDFVIWRQDNVPSYQLAVTVDDAAMEITEVVRGCDLLLSTARQILLYHSLGFEPPKFFHCPLMTDDQGIRLAKRHDALSLRALRAQGLTPEKIRAAEAFQSGRASCS